MGSRFQIVAAGLVAVGVGFPAAAGVTFAVYNPVPSATGPAANVFVSGTTAATAKLRSGTPTTGSTTAPVIFTYVAGAPLIALGHLNATLGLRARETPFPVHGFGLDYFSGEFHFTYSGPTKAVGTIALVHNLTNLLSGRFSGAEFASGGSSATLLDSNFSGSVTYASDLIDFSPGLDEDFAIGITSASPPLSFTPAGYVVPFAGVSQGSFGDTLVFNGDVAAIPEPATWALLLAGFAGIGVAARTRARRATTVGDEGDQPVADSSIDATLTPCRSSSGRSA